MTAQHELNTYLAADKAEPSEEGGWSEETKDAVGLVGVLMARSASDLAWTNEQIHDSQKAEIRRLRTLVLDMAAVFDEATVVDRVTESRWRMLEHRIVGVERSVDWEASRG